MMSERDARDVTSGPGHSDAFLKVYRLLSRTKRGEIFSSTLAFSFCFHPCTVLRVFLVSKAHIFNAFSKLKIRTPELQN